MPYEFRVSDVTPGRDGGKRLAIVWTGQEGEVAEATNVEFRIADLGAVEGHVAIRDLDDNDVQAFLQGALDAAWGMGLRPAGYEDVKTQLSEVSFSIKEFLENLKSQGPIYNVTLSS